MPEIVIFRDHLLPPSETFILKQGEMLQNYRAHYAGSRRVAGLELPSDRTLVLHGGGWPGKVAELLFKVFGRPGRLLTRIRVVSPRLIHAHFGPDGALALPLAQALRIPLIVTFHGYDATVRDEYARRAFLTHRLYIRRRPQLIERGDRFIAVSAFIKDRLVAQGFPAEKIHVHYIGVDTVFFQPIPGVERKPVILFVGRLVPKKGCDLLIRAMGIVHRAHPQAELVVIGDGPQRASLEGLAARSLGERFRFLGFQPQEEVKRWISMARALVTPSVTDVSGDSEGLPIANIEALAMSTPVVSFRHAGIPEAILHGEVGLLSDEGDWEGLSKNILHLLQDEELWTRLSRNARPHALARFDLQAQTQALESHYDAVLQGRA